jgi:hypothetical protein
MLKVLLVKFWNILYKKPHGNNMPLWPLCQTFVWRGVEWWNITYCKLNWNHPEYIVMLAKSAVYYLCDFPAMYTDMVIYKFIIIIIIIIAFM